MTKPTTPCNLMSFDEAKEKLKINYSCLNLVRLSEHVLITPKCIGSAQDVKLGIKAALDGKLNRFDIKYKGVPVAYGNITSQDSVGMMKAGSPMVSFNLMLDYIVFSPAIGSLVKGVVNKVSSGHIGVVIHNTFNASILRSKTDHNSGWQHNISEGQEVIFEILNMHSFNSLLVIEGTIREDLREDEIDQKETFSLPVSEISSENNTNDSAKKKKKRKRETDESCVEVDNGLSSHTDVEKNRKRNESHDESAANQPDIALEFVSQKKIKKERSYEEAKDSELEAVNGVKQKNKHRQSLQHDTNDDQSSAISSPAIDGLAGKKKKKKHLLS